MVFWLRILRFEGSSILRRHTQCRLDKNLLSLEQHGFFHLQKQVFHEFEQEN